MHSSSRFAFLHLEPCAPWLDLGAFRLACIRVYVMFAFFDLSCPPVSFAHALCYAPMPERGGVLVCFPSLFVVFA